MKALPDAMTEQMLREIASTYPWAVLGHRCFARLARSKPVAHAEIRAIAQTETTHRAIARGLTRLDRKKRRLVLCDCTEQSLATIHQFSARRYDPALPAHALVVARQYALRKATVGALAAADQAAWDEWSRVCDMAEDAPWNASLTAIRKPTVTLASAALRQIAWFVAQEGARGASKADWARRWEEANLQAHRRQARTVFRYAQNLVACPSTSPTVASERGSAFTAQRSRSDHASGASSATTRPPRSEARAVPRT